MLALGLGGMAALCWGIHDLLVRRMSQQADTAACMAVVLMTGCLCLAALGLVSGATPDGHRLLEQAASGFAFAVASYCLWCAFGSGSVRLVAPIVAAYPVVSLLLATLSGEHIRLLQWLLVLVVIGGVAIVTRGESLGGSTSVFKPVAWAIAAAVGFAVTFWSGQQAMETGDTVSVLVFTRIVAAATVVVFMLFSGGLRLPGRRDIPVLLAMGLADTIALGSVLYAGRLPGGTFAAVTASLFGVVTILLARAFLKERLLPIQWMGVVVTFAAIGFLGAT